MNMTKTITKEIDLCRLHDVIVDVFYDDNVDTSNLDEFKLEKVFNELPDDVQAIAIQWGGGDTVFGDEAYRHIEKNKELFKRLCELTTEGNKT